MRCIARMVPPLQPRAAAIGIVPSDHGSAPMPPSQDPSDAELMRRVVAGSESALEILYARFARPIFGLAAHSLDRAAAEDVLQDVFLALWRRADRFEPDRGTVRACSWRCSRRSRPSTWARRRSRCRPPPRRSVSGPCCTRSDRNTLSS